MKNTGKMSLDLNLAKLVRFQRTNQALINPIYDASLPCFTPKEVVGATGETFPKTIHARFSLVQALLFAESLFFSNAKRRLEVIFSIMFRICNLGFLIFNPHEVVIGKSTGKQTRNYAQTIFPQAHFHLFLDKTNKAVIRNTKDKLEVNYV